MTENQRTPQIGGANLAPRRVSTCIRPYNTAHYVLLALRQNDVRRRIRPSANRPQAS